MYKRTPLLLSLSMMIAVMLSGCASNEVSYHTLRAKPIDGALIQPGKEQQIVALRHLTMPNYLDDKAIVYLKGSSEVVHAKGHKWAENLSTNLRNVIIDQLKQMTGNPSLLSYPLANNIRPAQIIDIQISDFAAQQDDSTLLIRADWQVTQTTKTKQPPQSHTFNRNYPLDGNTIDSLMLGYQQAIADLTLAISKTLH